MNGMECKSAECKGMRMNVKANVEKRREEARKRRESECKKGIKRQQKQEQ